MCFSDNLLFIGLLTKTRLRKLRDEGDISQTQQSTFYKSVKAFYARALEYAISNLPLKDDLLQNARFLNFHRRESANLSEVDYFAER